MNERVLYLDGMRGVAILMVFFFHAFSRWGEAMPYGNAYKQWFSYGWLGVQLFFLISGFVILMSLERSVGFKSFVTKRWLRLFPSMVLVSMFVYFSSSYFYERPNGVAKAVDLIPGLLFVDPSWINKFLGFQVASIEGAFWSLYVEFKFYLIAGLSYFYLGRVGFVCVMCGITGFVFLVDFLKNFTDLSFLLYADKFKSAMSFQYFPWFLAGAAVYLYRSANKIVWLSLAVIAMLIGTATTKITDDGAVFVAALVCFVFLASKEGLINKILETKSLIFFGYVSYPLYLCYEGLMVSIVNKLDKFNYPIPNCFYSVFALMLLSLFSYLI